MQVKIQAMVHDVSFYARRFVTVRTTVRTWISRQGNKKRTNGNDERPFPCLVSAACVRVAVCSVTLPITQARTIGTVWNPPFERENGLQRTVPKTTEA